VGLALMAIAVFVLEPYTLNILRKGHFNWVSHHSLAIAMHSVPGVGFAGYSCKLLREDGSFFYDYFNRYPFPFALVTRLLLGGASNNSELLYYAARQLMNVIFLINSGVLVLVGLVLGFGGWLSIFSLLIVASSGSWLYYKSMYHFDQPALLGFSVVLLLVAFVWKNPSRLGDFRLPVMLVSTGVAVLSGRTGAILIFLSVCLVIHLLQPLSFWRLAGRDFLFCLVFSLLLLAAFTGYSIVVESRLNAVEIVDTSVVRSAMRRLGISLSGFPDNSIQKLSWLRAIPSIIGGALTYCSPGFVALLLVGLMARLYENGSSLRPISLACASNFISLGLARPVFALNAACGLTGLIWCFGMKNLVVFHDYSAMYVIPFLYLSAISVAHQVMHRVLASKSVLLCVALALFVISLLATQASMQMRPVDQLAYSNIRRFYSNLDLFRSASSRSGYSPLPVVRDRRWVPGSPYAQCLYLDNPLVGADDLARMRRLGANPTIAQAPSLVGSP
jgi:hypothetical protein